MIFVALALIAVGSWICLTGLIARRQGFERRCSHCDYILSGLHSRKCPECGSEFSESEQCVGQQKRKLSRIAYGVPVLLLGMGLVSDSWLHWSNGIIWYRCLPTSLVARSMMIGERNATAVLTERCLSNRLSRADAQLITRSIVTLAEDSDFRRLNQPTLDLFESIRMRGLASPDQLDRLYGQLVRPTLAVRPIARQGDAVPIIVKCWQRCPSGAVLRYNVTVEGLKVDGKAVSRVPQKIIQNQFLRSSRWAEEALAEPLTWLAVGHHMIELELKLTVFADNAIQFVDRKTVCKAACYVSGSNGPDSVGTQKVSAAALRDDLEVRAFVSHSTSTGPDPVVWTSIRWRGDRRGTLCGQFVVRNSKGRELSRRTEVLRSSDSTLTWGSSDANPPAEGDLVSVTFESSREQARATTDVIEMYEGRVIFDKIRVNPLPQAPPTTSVGQFGN